MFEKKDPLATARAAWEADPDSDAQQSAYVMRIGAALLSGEINVEGAKVAIAPLEAHLRARLGDEPFCDMAHRVVELCPEIVPPDVIAHAVRGLVDDGVTPDRVTAVEVAHMGPFSTIHVRTKADSIGPVAGHA